MTETVTQRRPRVHRIEVRPRQGAPDPLGGAALRDAESVGASPAPDRIECANVYLLQGDLEPAQLERLAEELFADPITEEAIIGSAPPRGDALIEVHPLPGVMDPDADAVRLAIRTMLDVDAEVSTGRRYDFHGTDARGARTIAERAFANTVVHGIHDEAFHPPALPAGAPSDWTVRSVPLVDLDDEALLRLSRDAHLFLSLDEMKAIQAEYRRLDRDPREIELETLAQTWSEHCVHKTLKATIRYTGDLPDAASRPGHEVNPDGSVTIRNLLRSTVVAATRELIDDGVDWCLSVFVDNAGIIAFDDEHAVCFKVETHNHPSAIEPYGGAATGIGGCIRDILGTGLAARPIAATDVFCVAHPDSFARTPGERAKVLPAGCLHPRRILRQVVAGVRDYGNRMGIPTLNGAVWFDDRYVGNPLVYCGCVGVMPRDLVEGDARPGDAIIAIGGRTGRDGIHGATFSSSELTDTHADEFSHAVQIGNPVTEKKMRDVILEARDGGVTERERGRCIFTAITDCGAGGFSSAVGEMGEMIGAEVNLERAPLKYEGLSPTEIWISEAQERMVLAVPPENVDTLRALCDRHDVELCELGRFGTEGRELILKYDGAEVGRLPMEFLHEGLPGVTREARFTAPSRSDAAATNDGGAGLQISVSDALLGLLAHPNIASKQWIIRQYDHEVQGASVVKPLVGPVGEGPGDAAVILPVAGSERGLAIANGLATGLEDDPYLMALAAIDECVRNLVCVGADPSRTAILDNFCWPSCNDPENLGRLVRASEGCYDGAKAYRTPFISGKDSLNNQFATDDGRTIEIPPTLLISGFGIVPDVRRCVTMDAKAAGNLLVAVGRTEGAMGGSHYLDMFGGGVGDDGLPRVDLEIGPRTAGAVHQLIARGLARSAHDCSEGGLLLAAAEMAIAGDLGVRLDLLTLPVSRELPIVAACFAETPSRYLLEVQRADLEALDECLSGMPYAIVGEFVDSRELTLAGTDVELDLDEMKAAWLGTLDW